jgi:tRNA (cytidine/uridine-2'-O-)-methyltransferase
MKIVLIEPQIPQNTGSIARTCAATSTPLAIVGETPFTINEKNVRRAGLDYWPYVDLKSYRDWQEYREQNQNGQVWLLSSFGNLLYYNAEFKSEDHLVFGSETKGLSTDFVKSFPKEYCLTIPMSSPAVRSLNLSNAVSIVLYEARRQLKLDEDYQVRSKC